MSRPRSWTAPALAADASARAVFAAHLHALIRLIESNRLGAAAGREPEYLHALRAGLRRLRSVLRAFRPLLVRRRCDGADRALRGILHALGPARDWDVFLQAHGASRLAPAARRERAAANRRARAVLRSPRFRSVLRRLRAWQTAAPWRASADPDQPAGAFAGRALRRLRQGLRKAARGIDWSDAPPRHRVRIRAKRLRYGCESFAAAHPRRAVERYLKRLRKLQRVLGEMNDLVVQRGQLRHLARDPRLGAAAAALSLALARRERRLAREVPRRWRKLDAARPFWQRQPAAATS